MKTPDRLVRLLHWEPNPIVVKELRQAVRSNILAAIFCFLLLLFFSVSAYLLVQQSGSDDMSFSTGKELCTACLGILVIGSLLFVPLYTGIRVAREQRESDLVLCTPLPASKVVQGKIMSALYLVTLFFSAGLPFIVLSHFLRGIDWFTIQFAFVVLLYAALLAVLSALAVAVLPVPVIIKSMFGLGLCLALVIFSFVVFGVLAYSVESGAASIVFGEGFFSNTFLPILVCSLFPLFFCYGLSKTQITSHRLPGKPLLG